MGDKNFFTIHQVVFENSASNSRVFGLARFKNEEYTLYLAAVCLGGLARFKNEEYTPIDK